MRVQKAAVISVGLALFGGPAIGMMLGHYAVRGVPMLQDRLAEPRIARDQLAWPSTDSSTMPAPAVIAGPAPSASPSPEQYVCEGCGPTLAERVANGYDPGGDASDAEAASPSDTAPLPQYQSAPDVPASTGATALIRHVTRP